MATRIDGHVHIWPRDKRDYPPEELSYHPFAREDGDASLLIEFLDSLSISRAIAVQTAWYARDDRYVAHMVARYPGRITGVGCLPFRLDEAEIAAGAHRLGMSGMRGCRIQVIDKKIADLAYSGAFKVFFERAAEIGDPILFYYRNFDMHDFVASTATEFGDFPIVIEHMAYAAAKFGKTAEYIDRLMALSRHPQVHIKLCVHHQISEQPFPWADLHAVQGRFISEFGAERILWGSNFPKFLPDPTYEQRQTALRDHYPFRSVADRDWVLGGTAEKLWPLRTHTKQG